MEREYHKWYSEGLQREMELLVFGHSGRAVLFFPTRMARFYDYENWGIIEAIGDSIDRGEIQVFCVDSLDAESFYNASVHPSLRIARHIKYEQYILQEVIPFMHAQNPGDYFEAAGCSMGAYHAANLALKYPLLFKKAICMSGRYDLTRQIGDFRDLFDGYHNEDIYFNTPRQFISNLHNEFELNALRDTEIIFAIGETDPFIMDNKEFSGLLWDKGIPNHLYVWNGYAHRPRAWRQMVKLYF